jgi:hypothetical protein
VERTLAWLGRYRRLAVRYERRADIHEAFLELATALTEPGDLLAVEYRTVRDAVGVKVTGDHYRRFVMPANFEARALAHGFAVRYAVEGFGFAKYQEDDAYVARTLLEKP